MLVNDIDDAELPVSHVIIKTIMIMINMDENNIEMEGSLQCEGEYYHAKKSVWEPVVEPWSLQASLGMEPRNRIVCD